MAISTIKGTGGTEAVSFGAGTVTSFKNCTGTVSHNNVYFFGLANGMYFMMGRINITNFVRTGGNPGVNLTLPDIVPTPTANRSMNVGIRGQNPREMIIVDITAGSRTMTVYTSESFQNSQNGDLTFFVCAPVLVD